MLEQLQRALQDLSRAAGFESRRAYARVRQEPGGAVRVESSDPRLLEAALQRLPGLAGDLRLGGALLPDPALAGQVAWVAASVAEVRREPAHVAEQVTQALQGERLEPLLHESGWVLARLPDGYLGWVRDWHLLLVPAATARQHEERATARIDVPWEPVLAAPRPGSDPVGETILGTRVVTLGRERGWTEIELPTGRRGVVPESTLRDGTGPWPADVPSLLGTLRRFLGVPYLWGGKSPKGFDCSGLVQFAFALHGTDLPRDSDEQAACGVPADVPAAGDLLFFGTDRVTHVAVALDDDAYLHARGEVRCNALSPGAPQHDADLRSLWRGTRRVDLRAAASTPRHLTRSGR